MQIKSQISLKNAEKIAKMSTILDH